ncbi:putative vacuolar morphogenesis protein AvaB [Saitoella complicata NRRL Y-17804]|uniref:putative vacuolar morphogenesis protein AvaB n=1 Tax=Saitoella complicata (strain BCRC 22490 / CBS 7301 / JCM 7358 / NBRC 10748 / NRRL Y-17804) TaxID=698492 RepID=UPI00086705AC|nr:putative vacuolar morphogenesis protein AvaB [Saitoella complicata NRRL Y-17804]ODQ56459.1 putative vacuolar morphogenesis protein AvaB [Saitoella complicata NRRL Y-17804]
MLPQLRAFEPCAVVTESGKDKIAAVVAYDEKLLLATTRCVLRVYDVSEPDERDQVTVNLSQTIDKFAKKTITQLAYCSGPRILLALADYCVSVYDADSLSRTSQLTKTKNATTFAATSNIEHNEDDIPSLVTRIAVVVKRKLILYVWDESEFRETSELTLPESARTLTWISPTKICLGLSSDYCLADITTNEISAIFSPGAAAPGMGAISAGIGLMGGRTPRPMSVRLPGDEVLLARDTISGWLDNSGRLSRRKQVPWNGAPEEIGFVHPYLVALFSKYVQVRNVQTQTLLQTIEISGATTMTTGEMCYVASSTQVWRICPRNFDQQVGELVGMGMFDEAISLVKQLDVSQLEDKDSKLRAVRLLKADALFEKRRYDESMGIFSDQSAPPEMVLKLFPQSVAGDLGIEESDDEGDGSVNGNGEMTEMEKAMADTLSVRSSRAGHSRAPSNKDGPASDAGSMLTKHTETVSRPHKLSEVELKKATRALLHYLADSRRKLNRFIQEATASDEDASNLLSSSTGAETASILTVGSRVPEVHFASPTGEPASLEDLERDACLVDTALFRAYMLTSPSLVGSLVRLPNRCDPNVVRSMLEECGKVRELVDFLFAKKLHREALTLLQGIGKKGEDELLAGPESTIRYLQRLDKECLQLIFEFVKWPLEVDSKQSMEIFTEDTKEAESLPRDKVVDFLLTQSRVLAIQYLEHLIHGLSDGTPEFHNTLASLYFERMTKEDGVSEEDKAGLQTKFLEFLRWSQQYRPERVLSALPRDDPEFYEARAIVLSKLGQYQKALEIYVFKMKDYEKAEQYCIDIQATDAKTPSLFLTLLTLYLQPPAGESFQLNPALTLLTRQGRHLDSATAISLLPPTLPVADLHTFFRTRIRSENSALNSVRIIAALRKSSLLKTHEALIETRNVKAVVDEERMCPSCHKRLGMSVIAVFPEGSIVHYGCQGAWLRERGLEGVYSSG